MTGCVPVQLAQPQQLGVQAGAQDMEGAQTFGATTPTPGAAAGNILQSTVGVGVCNLPSEHL